MHELKSNESQDVVDSETMAFLGRGNTVLGNLLFECLMYWPYWGNLLEATPIAAAIMKWSMTEAGVAEFDVAVVDVAVAAVADVGQRSEDVVLEEVRFAAAVMSTVLQQLALV